MSVLQPHLPPLAETSLAWRIDQQAIGQGLAPATTRQMAKYQGDAAQIWEKAARLADAQPIITYCDDAACREIAAAAAALSAVADRLVVIGTGGASLGAQSLCAFAPDPARVIFLENCDAHSAHAIFSQCAPAHTAWAIISKSGETVETLAATLALIARYQAKNATLAARVLVITSAGQRPLRALAQEHAWPILDHPPELGGRFSVFSPVGFLPAAFAGLSIPLLTQAARQGWQAGLEKRDPALFAAAAWFAASLAERPLHVVMAYSDRLRPYTQWYKQLWAESLGKNLRGPTPITATGSIDQHSQLQLYLDGAPDKLFTLILPEGRDTVVPLATTDIPSMAYLSHHTMEDIMEASAEATCATLLAKNLPIRILRCAFNATSLCQLMVRTILETLLVAAMLDIDPYSQPAVEEGKYRARRSLGLEE